MENIDIERKFNVKDLVMLLAVTIVGVLVVLSMYMVDRQWRMMANMRAQMIEQGEDIRDLRIGVNTLQTKIGSLTLSSDSDTTSSLSANNELSTSRSLAVFSDARDARSRHDYGNGDWLVSAFAVGLKTISPYVSADAYAAEVQDFVLESLLVRNPKTLEWEGLLAESWQVDDNGLNIDFKIRPNLRFSDGKPLTAADVEFSFRFVMDERIAAPHYRSAMQKIASVTALDPLHVRFSFKEPYFESLGLAGELDVLPEHFYAEFLLQPEVFNQSRGILMGSGPYRLQDPRNWTPDEGRVELTRNQRYWGEVQPPYDRVVWNIIENDSARLAAFRNGTIDDYASKPREYQALLADPQIQQAANSFEFMSPTAGYSYIGWNQRREGQATIFAQTKIRLAMTLLTDRGKIVDDIMLGYAEPAVSPFNPRSVQHNPELLPRTADIEQARVLLNEAGYRDRDGDGVLENEALEPFEFELVYYQDSDDTRRIVLLLKDLYARAGIVLKPKPTEWSVMIDLLNNRNFDAITLGWGSDVETDIHQMFHSSQVDGGGDNFIHFQHAELDKLIEQARATVDEAQRMKYWWQAEKILYQQQPYTFLMRRKSLQFVDKRIKNLAVNKLGLNYDQVPVVTYVPDSLQRYTQ